MYRSSRHKMVKRAGVSTVLAIGAIASGAGIAGIASASTHSAKANSSAISPRDNWPTTLVPMSHFGGGLGGLVTAVTATTLTVQNRAGVSTTYTIGTSTVVSRETAAATASDLAVGEFVNITLASSGSTTATKVDIEPADRAGHGRGIGGLITSLTGTSVTVKDLGGTSTTFTTDASTKVFQERTAATLGALAVGEQVMIMPSAPGSTTAAAIDIELAHVAGKVTALNGNSITLSGRHGTATVVVSSSTTYSKNGAAATLADVTVGSFIFAEGAFDPAHTTLTANTVGIGQPPLGGAALPEGFGEHSGPSFGGHGGRGDGGFGSGR